MKKVTWCKISVLYLTFSTNSKAQPYKDVEVKIKELIKHIQKRMISWFWKLFREYEKSNSLKTEPGISKLIDGLTTYYGLAYKFLGWYEENHRRKFSTLLLSQR